MTEPVITGSATIASLLSDAYTCLQASSDSPRLDAEVLLAHLLAKPRSHLLAWPEKTLEAQQVATFIAWVRRRQQGVPVAYLTGVREFWSLPIGVSEQTLIPRADTERLVELSIDWIRQHRARRILELGTGSGAIAMAIARECPDCQILACDVSARALAVACHNAQSLKLKTIEFKRSDWFACIPPGTFDCIISNPPYIAESDPHLKRGDVVYEPRLALVSGVDGLDAIRHIIDRARHYLRAGGLLALEHGNAQGAALRGCWRTVTLPLFTRTAICTPMSA